MSCFNVSIVDFEHIKSGWDQCITQYVIIDLLENFLHYQNGILLLTFSTDFSAASIVCLVVW